MDTGPLLASGRDADVFEYGPGRVLRRYRRGGDTAHEADVMRHVAAHGFPVPTVVAAGGPDLVLERLDGPTAWHALRDGLVEPESVGAQLADLHRRLHAVPARTSPTPGRVVVHLDLHPDNVLLTTRGPVVVDWRNADDGSADVDVALSALILAQVALDTRHPLAPSVRPCLTAFLERTGQPPASALTAAAAFRAADPAVTPDERARIDRATDLVAGS
ncbi:phosphotransferase [Geodermatophilus saharensis]|uniref:phosphotransferase n=1 Tax=Geodermatophilus saharensis TaxID=1137994 RepID=UPI000B791FC3|nr:phosphotransferase [Geodermatophilus saharensis]